MEFARGNRFLGLAWDVEAADAAALVLSRLRRVTQGWSQADRAGTLLCCELEECWASAGDSALCLGSPRVVETGAARAHDPAALLERIGCAGVAGLPGLAPPFSLAWSSERAGGVEAAADPFGIGQLFYVAVGGVAGVSNSAALLAGAFDCGLDAQALAGFALFGAFQEGDTPFAGVEKLPAGSALRLFAGRCEIADGPPERGGGAGGSGANIAAIADLVRATATRLSDAIPDADLQLSGGLDSRLILAALPAERRRRHRVVTIGGSASPDVRIARAIASRLGLRHEVIDTGSVERLGAQDLHDTLQAAVHGYDFASNPIDKVSLMLANRRMGGGGCFNGQNGEILRGFYFPGQPLARRPDESLAQGLIRMRLEANDRVDPSLFPPERYRESRSRAEARAVRRLVSLGATWSDALDRFYLYERMQRWAGNGLSNFLSDRVYLCPFLDPDFVAASLAVPARARSNSRAAFELLAALDPELAAIPLDSGLRPSLVVEAPLRARLAEAGYIVDKAVARLKRSLKGGGRATLGSATVAQLWHRHRLFERLPGDRLLATGLFEPTALDALLTGRLLPDRPTLGFLLMMAELVRRE